MNAILLKSNRFPAAVSFRLMALQSVLGILGILFPVSTSGQIVMADRITTYAGSGTQGYSGDGGPATSAALNGPVGVAFDHEGNLYFSEDANNTVRKVAANGVITTLAGNGTAGFGGDGGPGGKALLSDPAGIALDAAGNLYVADTGNFRIRKISPTGTITTFAGTGGSGESGNGGPATSAQLEPTQLAFDAEGNLYVACGYSSNFVVRKISQSGVITAFAGTGTVAYGGDGGLASSATFSSLDGIAVDASGNVYVSSIVDHRVREITVADGKIHTVAGNGTAPATGDGGPATSAGIAPQSLAFDPSGNLFVVDVSNFTIREVFASNQNITTFAGNGTAGFSGDGSVATQAQFGGLFDLAFDSNGTLYAADLANNRIRAIGTPVIPPTNVGSSAPPQSYLLQTTAAETISSFAVPTSMGGKQEYTVGTVIGCVVDGKTINPVGTVCTVPVTFTPAYPGQRPIPLQAVTSTGNVNFPLNGLASAPLAALTPGIGTTIAGTGVAGNTGDGGPATSAKVGNPIVATDGVGNIYFADSSFQVVRRIDALTGVITKVAGTGVMGYSGDGGPALQATFGDVQAVTVDGAGNLYIADSVDCVVRKITAATGIITTVAGNGTLGYSGVGGLAVNAQLCPDSLTVDASGNLYLTTERNYAETAGSWVLKVTASTGVLSVVAGTGVGGYTGDGGPATAATLNGADGVALDDANNVYIADGANSVIRKVDAVTGIITTIAGTGAVGYTGDGGPATSATMEIPRGIVADSAGDVYFTDCCTYTVRKIDAATGIIRTVAGGGSSTADGVPATTQGYSYLDSVALDGAGNIYFGDFNARLHKVDVSRTSLTYPTPTLVGSLDSTDDPQTAELSNIGNAPLALSSPSSGQNPTISSAWTIENAATCPQLSPVSAAFTMVPGASCSFPVDFEPTVAGANTGTLVVTDDSLNVTAATQTIGLAGTGIGGISISPTSIAFPSTPVGATSAALTATINNAGTSPVYLSTPSLTDSSDFTQSDNCNGLVANGGACTVTFAFTPTTTGPLTSTYSIHDLNNPGNPLTVALSGNGTPAPMPQAVLNPSSLSFITVVNTAAYNQTVTLSNPGTGTLNIGSIAIGGINASSFTIVANACGSTLSGGSSCKITVGFPVIVAGTYSATLTVTDDATPTTQTVALSGTVKGTPQAVLNPTSLSFTAAPNNAAASQTVTLSNPGTATLNIASIGIGGTNAAAFTLASNACGTTLAAGLSCTLTVGFPANSVGLYAATITVTDDATPTTQSVSLSGTVTGTPQAVLNPTSLSFTTVVNTAAYNQTVTLSNPGTATLSIASVAIGGANASSFTLVSNACGSTLTAGSSCKITVGFPIIVAGTYAATLTVKDNATPTTQSIPLSGTVTGTPQAVLNPASLSFTAVPNTSAASQSVTLSNPGTATLDIASIGIGGANATAFTLVSNNCGSSLTAGNACTLTVGFQAAAVGNYAATVSVTTNATPATQVVSLAGNVIPPPDFTLTVTPPAQSSYLGAQVSYQLAIASLSTANPYNTAVELSATGLPAGATAAFAPASVTPGAATVDSVLTITIPTLQASSEDSPIGSRGHRQGALSAALLIGMLLFRDKRLRARFRSAGLLLLLLCLGSLATTLTGCGGGNGFAVPQTTSTITVTGTSGTLIHSATVTLTLK